MLSASLITTFPTTAENSTSTDGAQSVSVFSTKAPKEASTCTWGRFRPRHGGHGNIKSQQRTLAISQFKWVLENQESSFQQWTWTTPGCVVSTNRHQVPEICPGIAQIQIRILPVCVFRHPSTPCFCALSFLRQSGPSRRVKLNYFASCAEGLYVSIPYIYIYIYFWDQLIK